MAEYIDKVKLEQAMYQKAFIEDSDLTKWDGGCWIRYKLFENVVESIPIVDVQPVTHGEWEEVHEWMGDVEYSCSVCGCYAPWKQLTTDQVCTEYCPYCGAKMDGDKNG